jgi:Ca-activated chloride channel family protein
MDLTDPHLLRPWVLGVVAAVALGLAWMHLRQASGRAGRLASLLDPRAIGRGLSGLSDARRNAKAALGLAALLLLGAAAAGPRWGVEVTQQTSAAEDVVFVLDTSRSMLVKDLRPSRLERAKAAIASFVQRKGTGSVGLVAFSGQAFLQCPLTRDYDAFYRALGETDTRAIPVSGTDIARALEEAEGAFAANRNRKLVLLLTDGEDLEAGGVEMARKLARKGLVVHTIGVGTESGGPITVVGPDGLPDSLRDAEGNPVTSRLDEETLTKVAEATRGRYVRLGQAGEGLEALRLAIQAGTDAQGGGRSGIPRESLFVSLALLLMVIESLLTDRRRPAPQP